MTKQRDSMIFYRSFYEAINQLPNEQQLPVFNAIMEFSLNFNEIELENLSKTIFILIKPQLDANNKRFRNGCKAKDKQNGSKTEAKNKQKISKTEANNNVNLNVNENVNENENKEAFRGLEKIEERKEYKPVFHEFINSEQDKYERDEYFKQLNIFKFEYEVKLRKEKGIEAAAEEVKKITHQKFREMFEAVLNAKS